MFLGSLLVLLAGCDDPPVAASPVTAVLLTPTDRLVRASMALRGLRPSVDDLVRVQQDPRVLADLVDDYLDSPEFGQTVRDMHAEVLQQRGVEPVMPAIDLLADYSQGEIARTLLESPLRLVEEVVMSDSPYTDVVTADYAMANELMTRALELERLEPDLAPDEWGRAVWLDGRPAAGLLASSGLWMQHLSAGENHHRGRANLVSEALLCSDFVQGDVTITAQVDLTDADALAETLRDDPACASCHETLDPLAAFLWGFRASDMFHVVNRAYQRDENKDLVLDEDGEPTCLATLSTESAERGPTADGNCLPLVHYVPADQDGWLDHGLPEPGYFGQVSGAELGLDDLGRAMADDPRFTRCAVKRVAAYLGQRPQQDLPDDWLDTLQDDFVASGFSLKSVARQVVLSDAFLSQAPTSDDDFIFGLQTLRPEQAARVLAQLTGFAWTVDANTIDCGDACWGDVDLVTSGRFGLRTLLGGTDATNKVVPTLTPTPVQLMGIRRLAAEAAAVAVAHDFGVTRASDRRLLDLIDPDDTSEDAVRDQLVALHLRILGEGVAPDSFAIDQELDLFQLALSEGGGPADAWELVLTLLLQDLRMVFY